MRSITLLFLLAACAVAQTKRPPRDPAGGVFFSAKDACLDDTAPIANPHVLGCWVQFFWSEIENSSVQPGPIAGAPALSVSPSSLPTNEMWPIGNSHSSLAK